MTDERLAELKQVAAAVGLSRHESLKLIEEVERLQKGLRGIQQSPYCMYENCGSGSYGIGVCDGHRKAAEMARETLGVNTELNGAIDKAMEQQK